MRKTILIALLASFGLASCKKSHTCVCTQVMSPINSSSNQTTSTTTSVRTVEHTTKQDAQSRCEGGNSQFATGNGVQNTTCNLKD